MATGPITNPPKYSPGDTVYIKSSAQKGFLESYRVEEVRHSGSRYEYLLKIKPRRFNDELQSVGDRNTLQQSGGLKFRETQLITVCEALEFKKAYLENQLSSTNNRLNQLDCDSGSGSGSG